MNEGKAHINKGIPVSSACGRQDEEVALTTSLIWPIIFCVGLLEIILIW